MHSLHRHFVLGLLIVACWLSSAIIAAPVTFSTALPVAEEEFIFRQQFRWSRSSDDPSEADRDLQSFSAISILGYGVNSKLALFAVLPFVSKSLDLQLSGMAAERDNQGLGDVSAFARYTLWQENSKGRTFRLAAVGGFSAPTGDDDERDRFGLLPPVLQDGSGAWDGFGAIVATYQTLNYLLGSQLSYRNNGEANGFEAGNETRFDLSWQYRLWPKQLTYGVPGFLYGVLEFNALHQNNDRFNELQVSHGGGDSAWLAYGLQYVTRRWVLEAVVQQPLWQDLNGDALKNDLMFTTGFRINF